MCAMTITFGIQKGGCAKTTSAAMTGYMLRGMGYRVLMVDMDSQGNLTEVLSGKSSNEFFDVSVLEAMQEQDFVKYTVSLHDEGFDLLPANNFLSSFAKWVYTGYNYNNENIGKPDDVNEVLNDLLIEVQDDYDFIIIDTPPALGELTLNALFASDYVVVMYDSGEWCYSAVHNFLDTISAVQDVTVAHDLQVAGILRKTADIRRSDVRAYLELIEEDYPDMVFETVLRNRATVGRLPVYGFVENSELRSVIAEYEPFIKELMERVGEKGK